MKYCWCRYRRFNGCLLLIKRKDTEVTVFDHGLGQAAKAAAGLSTWFSKRRNKLVSDSYVGADFYQI